MDDTQVKKNLEEILASVRTDLASIRTGRATSSMVDNVEVMAYGGTQRLKVNELATVSVKDAETITIDPWDKSIIGEIRQGILAANLGFTPSIDGEIIRIALSPLTGEDREKFVKLLNTKIENGKIAIRKVRGDILKDIKKAFEAKDISEDIKFTQEKKLQEIVDEYTDKIDELGEAKRQELLQI